MSTKQRDIVRTRFFSVVRYWAIILGLVFSYINVLCGLNKIMLDELITDSAKIHEGCICCFYRKQKGNALTILRENVVWFLIILNILFFLSSFFKKNLLQRYKHFPTTCWLILNPSD